MESRELIERLGSIMKLDNDAMLAYDRAIEALKARDIADTMLRFRSDHERHVKEIGETIRRLGGQPAELTPDLRGVFLEGLTSISGKVGDGSTLMACETGEKYVNYKYGQAVNEDFPPDVMALLERNYRDEKRHLSSIEQKLQQVPGRRIGKTIGLGALGVAAGVVIWRQIATRQAATREAAGR